MAVTSGFFDSINDDRLYSANDFGAFFDGIVTEGVLKAIGENFKVTPGTGSAVKIGSGKAWTNRVWSINDSTMDLTLPAAAASGNRIDTIYLEVNKNVSVRASSIKTISGTVTTSTSGVPVAPTLPTATNVFNYPIADIKRNYGTTSIAVGDITNYVGTAKFPFAGNALDARFEIPEMHRNIYRGKNLGSTYTAAQKTAVSTGTFEDLYIGDYWTINGQQYVIADINYYKDKQPKGLNAPEYANHLLIWPQVAWYTTRMHRANSTDGGYANCEARSLFLWNNRSFINRVDTDFGGKYSMLFYELLTTAVNGNTPSVVAWQTNCAAEAPSEAQISGQNRYANIVMPTYENAEYRSVGNQQFALLRLAPKFMAQPEDYWTRDIAGGSSYVIFQKWGTPSWNMAGSGSVQLKPYFLLAGTSRA